VSLRDEGEISRRVEKMLEEASGFIGKVGGVVKTVGVTDHKRCHE